MSYFIILGMLLPEEIAEERELKGKKIMTPYGWQPVTKIYKSIPLEVWELRTHHYKLQCAGNHLVMTPGGWKCVKDLSVGSQVVTQSGLEAITFLADTGKKEALYDITIEHPAHSFYSDGILSHNSTTFVARQLIYCHVLPRFKTLYVTPTHPMRETYASRYAEMESMFRYKITGQNKYTKRYHNGSIVNICYALTSARDIRGKTVHECVIDEAQNFDPEILPEVLYTMTTSDMPMSVYAGTALSIDTLLESKWQESSMGMWHIRAMDGKHWLNMYDSDTLDKVCRNPLGPTCPYTGKQLVVTDGCYVHANNAALQSGRVGMHVPQCIIPDIAYNPIQWAKVYDHVTRDNWTKVLQECFGIATAEGSREITEADLAALCTLKDTAADAKKKCAEGYYRLVISGCDWGGSDWNPAIKTKTSYTVHCIIGVAPDGVVDILHYKRYAGMDYREIAMSIIGDHNAYKAHIMASDFGVGMAYNMELRNYLPFDRHFVICYTGPHCEPIREPAKAHMANQLSVNRTEAVTNVFNDVKHPIPKIRCRGWNEMSPYLLDWLNMYRVPVEMPSGETLFKYIRQSTKADDALHAFTFAYTMAKIFKGESLVHDKALDNRIRAVMRNPLQTANSDELTMRLYGGGPNYIISG